MSSSDPTALYRFVLAANPTLAGKYAEVRRAVAGWLEYIPQSFPHYTRHTLDHSDQIAHQLSNLLFRPGAAEPTLKLSAAEAYVLLVCSLLHDTGMVASDADKAQLLESSEWHDWLATSTMARGSLDEIHAFRSGTSPADADAREFLADVALRRLVAEYVRRTHHERLVPVLEQHEDALGRFAFGDKVLRDTIGAICRGHGLTRDELDDPYHYPHQREVYGELINVRLMAVLLRLGDLLDLSTHRACPLLQNAAAPLPPDSLAHWTQFDRIRHRLTIPDRIEIRAECETADEHRVLRDWCQWLVEEVEGATFLMAGTTRHDEWKAPLARMSGPEPTITVRPAAGATYIPSDWIFELDAATVVERLVADVSREALFFVRELIQNGLDATRRRLADAHAATAGVQPSDVRDVRPELRAEHPLEIELRDVVVGDPATGDTEAVQELVIADSGVGMSQPVIERYLLQVGRSYYSSAAFRDRYNFAPSSRFGVGFLSVFRDSTSVTVETATAEDIATGGGGLRLSLTGPRSYILTERGSRTSVGTSIAVRLNKKIAADDLTSLVTGFCLRVEVPVVLSVFGQYRIIEAERPEEFCWERPVPGPEGAAIFIRAYPITTERLAGELYVVGYRYSNAQESWAEESWITSGYPAKYPGDPLPELPRGVRCVNGLHFGSAPLASPRLRLDYRGEAPNLGLSRGTARPAFSTDAVEGEIAASVESLVETHLKDAWLARGRDGWRYLNRLTAFYPYPGLWRDRPGYVPCYQESERRDVTLAVVDDCSVVLCLQDVVTRTPYAPGAACDAVHRPWDELGLGTTPDGAVVLVDKHLEALSNHALETIFGPRSVRAVYTWANGLLGVEWVRDDLRDGEVTRVMLGKQAFYLTRLADEARIGFKLHRAPSNAFGPLVLNEASPVVGWIMRVAAAGAGARPSVTGRQLAVLGELLRVPCFIPGHACEKLSEHLRAWRRPELEDALRAPQITLSKGQFGPPH